MRRQMRLKLMGTHSNTGFWRHYHLHMANEHVTVSLGPGKDLFWICLSLLVVGKHLFNWLLIPKEWRLLSHF